MLCKKEVPDPMRVPGKEKNSQDLAKMQQGETENACDKHNPIYARYTFPKGKYKKKC